MDPHPTAPDLSRGHILNGLGKKNAWMTTIQCVLGRDGDESVYLSHECRNENVPFSTDYDGADDGHIFQAATPNEFLTFTKGGHFHQFVASDLPCPASAVRHAFVSVDDWFFYEPVGSPGWRSSVRCPDAAIEPLGVAELLAGLNECSLAIRDVFVRVRLDDGHHLHFPANYINFSNRGVETAEYVQSISGTVICPFQGTYVPGYISCAATTDGRSKIEFAGWRNKELFSHLAQFVPHEQLSGLLRQLSGMAPAYYGTISLFADLQGEVMFYRYV